MEVYTLDQEEAERFRDALIEALENNRRVRIGFEDGVKLDVGYCWSLPFGTNTTGRS